MRAVLATAFPEKFVKKCVLPELRRRVEILEVVHPAKAETIDFSRLRNDDVVLHMVEFGAHTDSGMLARLCRKHGITIRALSRKKASWSFLPPPSDEVESANDEADELPMPEEEDDPMSADVTSLANAARGRDLKAAREHARLKQTELAEVLGTAQSTVSCYELGKSPAPDGYVKRLLHECGLPPGWRGLIKEEYVNAISTPVPSSSPSIDPDMATLYETEIAELKARIRALEDANRALGDSRDSALKASVEATSRLAEAESVLGSAKRQDSVQQAVRTLYEEGLLTADEAIAKLCPKR